jgi:hypothetical protein
MFWILTNFLDIYIIKQTKTHKAMTTQITIHPTVKAELINSFGSNPLTDLMIKTYEGIYNLALQDGKSFDQGHTMAMESLLQLVNLIK